MQMTAVKDRYGEIQDLRENSKVLVRVLMCRERRGRRVQGGVI